MPKTYNQRYYAINRVRRIRESRSYHYRIRSAIIELLGGRCVNCGFSDRRALQVDHVNGGGNKEKKISSNFYKYMLDKVLVGSKDYQILCANCNWIKRAINNENPRANIE